MSKHIYYLSLVMVCFVNAQTRYIDEVFDEVNKTEDIVYGSAPDLPFIFLFEWNTFDQDLEMDFYEPEGDNETSRPVIIFVHSGAFFSGDNEADDMVALSIASAKRGYVAVSIKYRLGLNVLSSYSGERAVYRGVQDASAAIRYLKHHSDTYGIDTNRVFMWGSSAGSFVALHLAYMDESDRPISTYGDDFDPDLGCVDCEGNYYVHSSKPDAVVNCWGAIGDLSWIDDNDNIPLAMFHGTLDAVVPFSEGYPFTLNIFLPYVFGSSLIHERMNSLGKDNFLAIGQGLTHEYWGTSNGMWADQPTEYFNIILDSAYSYLFDVIYPFLVGDVNNNGTIDFNDFSQLLNYILGSTAQIFEMYYADMNHDSFLDIFDLIMLFDSI